MVRTSSPRFASHTDLLILQFLVERQKIGSGPLETFKVVGVPYAKLLWLLKLTQ